MSDFQPSRAYRTQVRAVQRLSQTFLRVTLHAPDLRHFGTAGLDQRLKIVLPRPDGVVPDFGLFDEPRPALMQWYTRWRELPDDQRNPIRTYTARAVRPELCEVDIDFVIHGDTGPATRWVTQAKCGDELIIVGPDSRSQAVANRGVEWHPDGATQVLIVGDETAAPAICSILENLPAHFTGHAIIEVPDASDCLEISIPSQVQQRWLARGNAPVGTLLQPAVVELCATQNLAQVVTDPNPQELLWEVSHQPDAEAYAWLAGEAGVINALRRHLVREVGMQRRSVAFMGYWRHGRPES